MPVNFLDPRPGTPLADRPHVAALEAIRWIALFRLALPDVILRYAGGREVTLGDLQEMGMTSGINALITGNYLTTLGRSPQEDVVMLKGLKMPIGSLSKVDLRADPWRRGLLRRLRAADVRVPGLRPGVRPVALLPRLRAVARRPGDPHRLVGHVPRLRRPPRRRAPIRPAELFLVTGCRATGSAAPTPGDASTGSARRDRGASR